MKKFPIIVVAMVVIAAMVLSACGGAGNDDNANPGAGTPGVGTPSVMETPVGGALGTPTVDSGLSETPTAEMAAQTPTADMATTPAAGDTTPTAEGSTGSVPVTGNQCNLTTVNGLLGKNVVDSAGAQVGSVDSVIVMRDASAVSASGSDSTTTGAQTTPAAGEATPTAGSGSDSTGTGSAVSQMEAPQVAYLVLNLDDSVNTGTTGTTGTTTDVTPAAGTTPAAEGTPVAGATLAADDSDSMINTGRVVVPFAAVDLSAAGNTTSGGTTTTTTTDATPAAGMTPEATSAAGDMASNADCVVTLKNIQASALSAAPAFADDMDFSAADWDNSFRTYWSGQGLSIPATGASSSTMGAPVVLDEGFGGIDAVNSNGDGIGEVEDFILDPATGNVNYAVLAAGGFLGLGEKYIPVPASQVQWTSDNAGDATDLGKVVINVDPESWKNAPSFDSADQFNSSVSGWDSDIQSFWNGLDGGTVK